MNRHVPILLRRARALLRLPGGPEHELGPAEIEPATRAVLALHEGLVGARALARPDTYRDRHLGAYLLWWWPQTYAKVQAALRLAPMPASPRIVDLGAGPGPGAIAALDLLGGEALCADASAAAMAEARALGPVRTRQLDLARAVPEGEFDLAIAANVLSELPGNGTSLLRQVRARTFVFIEPALKETGRALLALRDAVLAEGTWKAAAPCLTQRPCPALASPRDWCTADLRLEPPRPVVQLAASTGLRADELLSFAPLVLSRAVADPAAGLYRVVGVPPPEKGKRRFFVCNDEGRVPLVRLDRDVSPSNAAFDRLERGGLVRLAGVQPRGDGLRVGRDSTVERPE